MRCPRCEATLPEALGLRWCEECDWNVAPDLEREPPRSRLARAFAAAGRRQGHAMAGRLLRTPDMEPRWTPGRAAGYALALAVHALTVGLFVAGVWLIITTFPAPLALILGLALIGLAVLMRPRLGKLDDDTVVLTPEGSPELHRLVAEVATALETAPPHTIALDADFNASWGTIGWRRRRVLILGMPLWAALDPLERVGLIGHELGHGRNGDARRGLVVGSALAALATLHWAMGSDESGEDSFLGDAANAVLFVLSRPIAGAMYLLLYLLLQDSQRAEFLADALAARAGGTEAAIRMEEKVLLFGVVAGAVRHHALGSADGRDVLQDISDAVFEVPPREIERRRRAARLEHARLSDTHPPSGARIALLEGRPRQAPAVVLDSARAAAIERELEAVRPRLAATVVEQYRSALYSG